MKQREDYNVYRVETYYGECGEVTKRSHFAGKTKAVSKAQAENNVRLSITAIPSRICSHVYTCNELKVFRLI